MATSDPATMSSPVVRCQQRPLLDINCTTAEELATLESLSSDVIAAIVANRPFRSVEELIRVPGLTEDFVERHRAFLTVADSIGVGSDVKIGESIEASSSPLKSSPACSSALSGVSSALSESVALSVHRLLHQEPSDEPPEVQGTPTSHNSVDGARCVSPPAKRFRSVSPRCASSPSSSSNSTSSHHNQHHHHRLSQSSSPNQYGGACSGAILSPSCSNSGVSTSAITTAATDGAAIAASVDHLSTTTTTMTSNNNSPMSETTEQTSSSMVLSSEGGGGSMGCDISSSAEDRYIQTFFGFDRSRRLRVLERLMEGCEAEEVRHVMRIIEPQFQRDFIALLPKEVALYVLSFLSPRDLLTASHTCRYWRSLANDDLLWKDKCRQVGIFSLTSDAKDKPCAWKRAYLRQLNIEENWRRRPLPEPLVLRGHDDHVITCLQFSGHRIVSGSDDNTLKVWSAVTGRCLRVLVGHSGGVWSSQMAGAIIVSGSTDRTLKVWNADTGECLHTLFGHTSTVRCMHLHGNRVVSGSRDSTLRLWDIETGECHRVFVGHVAAVRCVQYDGRLIVSGAYDYLVKVWDPQREQCLYTLHGHTNRVYSLQFDGVHVVSGSLDTSIRVWDVATGECKHQLMGHQSLTSGMQLRHNILVSGNADSTVKVWDIRTGQCLHTLAGADKHQSAVTCLQFNSKFVITSSDDGTVKLWDIQTGKFVRNLVSLGSGGSGGVVWRLRASETQLVCAVGSRNGTEDTKLIVLNFDEPPYPLEDSDWETPSPTKETSSPHFNSSSNNNNNSLQGCAS